MQYTLRNIAPPLDAALRQRASEERKSLNQVALEALQRGLGLVDEPVRQRDLSDLAGTWMEDDAFDEAIAEHEKIDPALWPKRPAARKKR